MYDGENLFIICFFKEQVKQLVMQKSFEVDMGFKRVQDPNINEIVFAAYMPEIRKSIQFV